MIEVPNPNELSEFNLKSYRLPPLEKYTDRRGYMYVLYDTKFPDHIKVGRTGDLYKRLCQYNSDKPHPTAKMLYISDMFEDVYETERKILNYMYDNTEPTTLSKEWFMLEHKQMIVDIITKAEELERENCLSCT